MELPIRRSTGELKKQLSDPLYRNSFFIILSSIMTSGFGFFFWMIAARLYPKGEIGIATALISSMGLIIMISRLGLDQYIIRFSPENDRGRIAGTAMFATTLVAIAASFVFVLGTPFWAPALRSVSFLLLVFPFFIIAQSMLSTMGTVFLSVRHGDYYFLQTLIIGLRIPLLLPLVFLGALGIFSSVGIATFIAVCISAIILVQNGISPGRWDLNILRDSFHFSAGNYIAGLIGSAPGLLFPILVLNLRGPQEAAVYYIVYAIASLLFVIPGAFGTSMFIEGSHGSDLRSTGIRTLKASFLLLLPCILVAIIFGIRILSFIGSGYIEGYWTLVFMALAAPFIGGTSFFLTVKKINQEIGILILYSVLIAFLLLLSGSLLLFTHGITGLGIAWLLAYSFTCAVIVFSHYGRTSNSLI